MIRDAGPGDVRAVLGVYSACIAADAGYLPFLEARDERAVLAWFRLKPLAACLVAEQDGLVAGVAGLRDANPGPGSGIPGGHWLEACHFRCLLAVVVPLVTSLGLSVPDAEVSAVRLLAASACPPMQCA